MAEVRDRLRDSPQLWAGSECCRSGHLVPAATTTASRLAFVDEDRLVPVRYLDEILHDIKVCRGEGGRQEVRDRMFYKSVIQVKPR